MQGVHNVYNTLDDAERFVVDEAERQVRKTFEDAWYSVPVDDRAEALVEALAVFFRTCTKK